jgi:hypothetical protein
MRYVMSAALALIVAQLSAQTPPTPTLSNQWVTVWDLPAAAASRHDVGAHDAVLVALAPPTVQGVVSYVASGSDMAAAVTRSGASLVRIISLTQAPAAALPNRSGYPDAFPRPGTLRKVLDNATVTVWDYTFTPGEPSPMHFHGHDTVTSFLKEGAVVSTTPDGTKTTNDYTANSVRFSPRNRTHTEVLVRGEERIIAVELK